MLTTTFDNGVQYSLLLSASAYAYVADYHESYHKHWGTVGVESRHHSQ